MANIVSATIRLLENSSPQDITLRDVARESGHGHRLIVEWFGGKGGLFVAVVESVLTTFTESGEIFYSDIPLRSEIRTILQIFNYMQMHHPDLVEQARNRLALETVTDRIRSVAGLAEDEAREAAYRLSLQLLGIVVFREYFPLSDDGVIRMMKDEFKASTGLELPDNPNRK